jgi:biopolymer transport protein ExbD
MSMAVSRQRGSIAEINITPMADVVIVLLIILMVTVPRINEGRVRNLPETAQSQDLTGEIVLSVAADATLDIGGRPIAQHELLDHLQSLVALSRDGRIQLKVDRELAYAALAPVLAICRQAGAEEIAFVTKPKPSR